MGCCSSRQSHQSSPPESPSPSRRGRSQRPSSSRNNIISTVASSPARSSSIHSQSCAPNRPLLPIPKDKKSKPPAHAANAYALGQFWTQSRLAKEREEFFETRVTGRPEVWGAVRAVVELVRAGDIVEAQSLLDAAGCTCPTGELWRGVFDERGGFYQIPEWLLVEPRGVVPDENGGRDSAIGANADGASDKDAELAKDLGEVEAQSIRSDEKGKGRAVETDPGTTVKIRCRLSDGSNDVVLNIGSKEKLSVLAQRVRDSANILPEAKLKIGYLGRIMSENETLESQGWKSGQVLNIFVFTP